MDTTSLDRSVSVVGNVVLTEPTEFCVVISSVVVKPG